MTDQEFYSSEKWRRLRRAILERDEWKSQLEKMNGEDVPAVTVHHIFPRKQYPEYQWEDWNLISLSLAAHNMMHDRDMERLSERGELLKEQVAKERGLKEATGEIILIIGMPGSGKTTYARENLKGGVCYDLDAIAAAFRLTKPKEERHKAARLIANDLFPGFAEVAKKYSRRILIIRTAPTMDDLTRINPDRIVIHYGGYGNKELKEERRHSLAKRIKEAKFWAEQNGIPVEEHDHDY